MRQLDWLVLILTLSFIVFYGLWKSRKNRDTETYLRANTSPWYMVGLTIMATQASAVTFLSAPGQAYTDGMRFVQYYFGLPLAMLVLCLTAVPIYHRLKVYTAYEYLEGRFDLKTRSLAAFLFLVQRGLGTGITVFAPSIILSSIFGWNIYVTNFVICAVVVIYTVSGGIRAVNYTQMGQMTIILSGMLIAGILIASLLPKEVGFTDALKLGGKLGHMNIIDLKFDLNNKYNIWSGILGGFFLALSYFGTDQSQVARYLTAKDTTESRLGLLFNGMVKIPMQFGILLIGVLLLIFYQFHETPVFFNNVEIEKLEKSKYAVDLKQIESKHSVLFQQKKEHAEAMVTALKANDEASIGKLQHSLRTDQEQLKAVRTDLKNLMIKNDESANTEDVNYIFLWFVNNHFPVGMVGLLIAVILAASMSSSSSALQALASTSVIDIYKRSVRPDQNDAHYLSASRWATIIWGFLVMLVAGLATRLGSLIEAVNVLGSLFYGAILGIFMVAFFMKWIKGTAVFYAALITQILVLLGYSFTNISFLWYNLIGCLLVMFISPVLQLIIPVHDEKSVMSSTDNR
ncbi:sodium:solute symporter [Solitalea canadensis]|uniref:Na+/proline symporter n=1 Tax=Solitalea canadensis (strain ATCC 29591 / DSM 3403 / JCM 21819 / LMG 8368 / NBRC 15130 / NCIMB 12057 / USAM 9D) TaxID=929556 RepID=H8KVE2_SOLCM|nr:sodium:solute symporter [Solitalea canadensis]AFD06322.1 Na+/proline symporter [Solitalea canadensis DSM 3403]